MAKKAMKAKRKYNRRKNVNEPNLVSETLDQALKNAEYNKVVDEVATQELLQPNRASERASIFLDDCRVPVRNLTDVKLLNERGRLSVKIYELRRTLESLENLSYQMFHEAEYRKL